MRFRALGHDVRRGDEANDIVLAEEEADEVGLDRYTDNQLETRLGPDGLAKKLLKIAREAKTAEEEQGVNILYLALGFVTWYEDETSNIARGAPLVRDGHPTRSTKQLGVALNAKPAPQHSSAAQR